MPAVFLLTSWERRICYGEEHIIFRGEGHLGSPEVFNKRITLVDYHRLSKMILPFRIEQDSLTILDCDGNPCGTLQINNKGGAVDCYGGVALLNAYTLPNKLFLPAILTREDVMVSRDRENARNIASENPENDLEYERFLENSFTQKQVSQAESELEALGAFEIKARDIVKYLLAKKNGSNHVGKIDSDSKNT